MSNDCAPGWMICEGAMVDCPLFCQYRFPHPIEMSCMGFTCPTPDGRKRLDGFNMAKCVPFEATCGNCGAYNARTSEYGGCRRRAIDTFDREEGAVSFGVWLCVFPSDWCAEWLPGNEWYRVGGDGDEVDE